KSFCSRGGLRITGPQATTWIVWPTVEDGDGPSPLCRFSSFRAIDKPLQSAKFQRDDDDRNLRDPEDDVSEIVIDGLRRRERQERKRKDGKDRTADELEESRRSEHKAEGRPRGSPVPPEDEDCDLGEDYGSQTRLPGEHPRAAKLPHRFASADPPLVISCQSTRRRGRDTTMQPDLKRTGTRPESPPLVITFNNAPRVDRDTTMQPDLKQTGTRESRYLPLIESDPK